MDQTWTPISQTPPTANRDYVVIINELDFDGKVVNTFTDTDKWTGVEWECDNEFERVTHWILLPELP